jgi:hypothetical protein
MSEDNEQTGSLAALLARIDERTKTTCKDVQEIKTKLETHYVTQDEFRPVKAIVYGMVGLLLTGIVTAILILTLKVKG